MKSLIIRTTLPLALDRSPQKCSPEEFALRYDWQENSGEMRNYTDIPARGPVSLNKSLELIHGYYACTSYVDAQVGRILQELDNQGLTQNTVVVFWSDHGFHLGEKGLWGKKDNTEMATRVPLILAVPGQKQNIRSSALVELVDIYPTLAEVCNLPVPAGLEGTSMAPLLTRPDAPWKKAAFSQFPRKNNTVIGYSIRTYRFRYNEYRNKENRNILDRQLYLVEEDPYEARNLINEIKYKDEIEELKKILSAGWKNALP